MASEYTLAMSEAEKRRFQQMAAEALQSEREAWTAAGIVPGARVADVGCGPAAILVEIARLIAPDGWIDGVERDPKARGWAEQMITSSSITNARIADGTAEATGLEAGAYDVVMMRHVLLHNGSLVREILAHLISLLRPGGHLYLVESDPAAIRGVPTDPDLTDLRERVQRLMKSAGSDYEIGAKLGSLLIEMDMELVDVQARYVIVQGPAARRGTNPAWEAREALVRAGMATEADILRWQAAMERIKADPAPHFIFVPMFRAVGRRIR